MSLADAHAAWKDARAAADRASAARYAAVLEAVDAGASLSDLARILGITRSGAQVVVREARTRLCRALMALQHVQRAE